MGYTSNLKTDSLLKCCRLTPSNRIHSHISCAGSRGVLKKRLRQTSMPFHLHFVHYATCSSAVAEEWKWAELQWPIQRGTPHQPTSPQRSAGCTVEQQLRKHVRASTTQTLLQITQWTHSSVSPRALTLHITWYCKTNLGSVSSVRGRMECSRPGGRCFSTFLSHHVLVAQVNDHWFARTRWQPVCVWECVCVCDWKIPLEHLCLLSHEMCADF